MPILVKSQTRILAAHESGNNGAVMGEAVLCEYFAKMAKAALEMAKGIEIE